MALVRVRGPLKQLAAGHSEHELVLRRSATVVELIGEFERLHPAVGGWVLDERGRIRPHINVFLNGEQCGAHTPVGPKDCIEILPAISGG